MAIDPTKVRLSESFMLCDFMGNYSAYHYGIGNPVPQGGDHIREGELLATYLDDLQDRLGPCRVSYGLIHPRHSIATVKWKPGELPSLHRWDDGAAADVCFVHRDRFMGSLGYWDDCQDAPINTALWISREHPQFTRMITYEQSPWMCIGTKLNEEPRLRFYENRYVGENEKPEHKKYKTKAPTYLKLHYGWKGKGHPRRGKEYQHVQISATTFLSDYLYDKHKVHKGRSNQPPVNGHRAAFIQGLQRAGKIIDRLHERFRKRITIVKAYDCDNPQAFDNGFEIELIPALGVKHENVADAIRDLDKEIEVRVGKQPIDIRRVRMTLQPVAKR